MKQVVIDSPYIPPAWIRAHGCDPVRIRPTGGTLHDCVARIEGLCPYTQGWISDVLLREPSHAIVMTTGCDQRRRAFEVVAAQAEVPCFLLILPSVWQTDSAFAQYQKELKRLGRFLEKLTGDSDIKEVITNGPDFVPRPDSIPLALVGSHGMTHDDELKGLIERLGGCVAVDTTEPWLDPATPMDTFDAMSRAYWAMMEDVFQRPNTRLYERLDRMIAQIPVAGVIVRRYLWCDMWHAEVHRIKAWSRVPVLDIEISSPAHTDQHRLATRIGAFMEMIA